MSKPTVFFSHSSRDRAALNQLKQLFVTRTGGAIDVFLSSDGQSIPLGQNWVHRIQEALERAQLMLVFLSPASIESPWLYFEAGFVYAKKIRVVPVAFLGAEISRLTPPITLLQGFNLNSEDGLGNIIALANDVFGHSHATAFSKEDYDSVITASGGTAGNPFGDLIAAVEKISLSISKPDQLSVPLKEALDIVANLPHHVSSEGPLQSRVVHSFGLAAWVRDGHGDALTIELDPVLAHATMPIANSVLMRVAQSGCRDLSVVLPFREHVGAHFSSIAITARLAGTSVELTPERDYLRFGALEFRILGNSKRGRPWLHLRLLNDKLELETIAALVRLLFDRGVFFFGSTWEGDPAFSQYA